MGASVADDMIRSYFERWHRLEEEKRTVSDDLKELFAEAKGNGLDAKALRTVFREQVGDKAARDEFDAICDLYRASLTGPRARPAPAHVEIIEEFDAETGEITEQPETVDETMGGLPVAAASETAEETGRTPAYTRMGRHGTPHGSGVTGGESAATENQERPSTNDKAYLEAVPQDEASLAGTGSRMLAGREGRHEGEAASADLPTHSNPQPSPTPEADKPEAVSPPAVSGALSDDDVPAFIKRDYVLRPHCLNPSLCAGSGSKHCHACLKARDEEIMAEGAAA